MCWINIILVDLFGFIRKIKKRKKEEKGEDKEKKTTVEKTKNIILCFYIYT